MARERERNRQRSQSGCTSVVCHEAKSVVLFGEMHTETLPLRQISDRNSIRFEWWRVSEGKCFNYREDQVDDGFGAHLSAAPWNTCITKHLSLVCLFSPICATFCRRFQISRQKSGATKRIVVCIGGKKSLKQKNDTPRGYGAPQKWGFQGRVIV